jgi:OHCU decarboxylase
MPDSITLQTLNELPAAQFVATLAGIFEHSPWVAERVAAARPFGSRQQLLEAMRTAVAQANPETQLALIRAHPKLGARGAQRSELTAASAGEQRRAGLAACGAEQWQQLERLNAAYLEKFGFPFILAVRGHDPDSIIRQIERRLVQPPALEQQAALQEIGLIAHYRLVDLVADPGS